jgi:hypothetical protein
VSLHISESQAVSLGIVARGVLKEPDMNGTERKYAQLLELRQKAGEILWWKFEGLTLKLADDTRYTPDFVVMLKDGMIECHETKGHWRDDALVKIKVASAQFPFKFRSFSLKNRTQWIERDFS